MSRELLAPFRAAIQKYDMIQPGDAVAVGVSGGKDSVALLTLLARLRRFYPVPYTVTAITLDPGFNGKQSDYSAIAALCDQLDVPYVLKRTNIWEAVAAEQMEGHPCSLCARMRRGILHRTAVENGCHTVALGHHRDDAAQTFMMNLLSGSVVDCFAPKSFLDRRGVTLIRPLIYIEEKEIRSFVRREELPVVKSACPVDGCTNRQEMADLIQTLSARYGDMNGRIQHALEKAGLSGWHE